MNRRSDDEALADSWIRMQTNLSEQYESGKDNRDGDDFDRGFKLVSLAIDKPEKAWPVIRNLIKRYSLEDLLLPDSDAQRVLGMLGAGPLEDLLAYHGDEFINIVEAEAKRDPKFRWVLRQVAQSTMTEELWRRVQAAAQANPAG